MENHEEYILKVKHPDAIRIDGVDAAIIVTD
jgi:hypothetical protein